MPDRKRKGWDKTLSNVGIPDRHRSAHFDLCGVYEGEAKKGEAWSAAQRFSGRDGTRPGHIEQRGLPRFAIGILGEYGTGKTFLATALLKHMLWNARTNAAMWRKFYDFIREVQSSYSQAAEETVRRVLKRYQSTPLLLLDDVGDLTIQEQTEDRRRLLYEVLDKRNDQMLPTILTSNLSPTRFKEQFGERTLERVLEMAALYRMDGRNYRKQPLDQDPMSRNA